MDDSIFEGGIDHGEFLIKAALKVPVRKFESPVLGDILDRLRVRYVTAIEAALETAQQKLLKDRAAKAMQFIVLDGGLSDLRKAEKERPKDGGYAKVSKPGSRGGKFWIDSKGHVRYDERPGGPPTGKHREATEEEVMEHISKQVSPTIFVGLDDDTFHAALEAGHFTADEASMVEFFRKQLNDEQVLGGVEGIHDISDIDARAFQYGGKSGAQALHQWLEEWWYEELLNPELYTDDKGNVDLPSKQEVRQWFDNLLTKYNKAVKDPDVQEHLKLNFVRLQNDAESLESDISKTAKVSDKMIDGLMSPENIQDAALGGLTLMKGMNLVFLPTSGKELGRVKGGKTNKRMKGQIHINEAVVGAYKANKLDLQSAEANEAQVLMLTVASHLSAHKNEEDGTYDAGSFRRTDGSLIDDLSDIAEGKKLQRFIEQRNSSPMSDGEKKHWAQRISELGEQIAHTINDQHDGKAPGVEEIMSSNAVKLLEKPDAIKAIKDKIAGNMENVQELLDAQENGKLDIPPGPMLKGRYGGEGKDPKGLPPHQINPQTGKPFGMFSWQKQAINWMEKAERGILAHGAGLGKTTSAVAAVEHLKSKGKLKRGIFFLPPALIPQWIKEIEDYAPGNTILDLSRFPAADREAILKSDLAKEASYILVSKGVLTGGGEDENSPKEDQAKDSFIQALADVDEAGLFVDECFPAGTMVGGKPIESIQVGDVVPSFDETTGEIVSKRVTHLFKSQPKKMVRVRTSAGEQVVTYGHPFWTPNGWSPAGALHEGGFVLRYSDAKTAAVHEARIGIEDSLHEVREDRLCLGEDARREGVEAGTEGQGILLSGTSSPVEVGVFLRAHEATQSNALEDRAREGAYSTPTQRVAASGQRWKRSSSSGAAVALGQCFGLAYGGGGEDWQAAREWLADLLQDRRGEREAQDRDRGGRSIAQHSRTSGSGQEEGRVLEWARVEGVTVLEPGSDGRFGGVCTDGHVYNLEVEDTHTYVANGFVVHNCHQGGFKNPENASSKITQKILTGRKYAFGMTATPLPNSPKDLFHLTNLFAPGTLGDYATWEGRLADTSWNPDANGGVGGYEVSNWSDLADLNRRAKPRVFVKKFDDPDVAPELAKVLPAAPKPEIAKVFLSEKPGSNGLSQQDYVHHGIPKMVAKRIEQLQKEREEKGEEPWGDRTAGMVQKLLTLNLQRQATISPELIDPKWKGHAPKIDHCVQHIIDHFKPGGGNEKGKGIVVFCNFKKAFPILKRELAARGIDPSLIGEVHGDSEFDRGATQDAFNGSEKDGKFESKTKIMLVGIKAGGAGLNLQKGGNATYFLDEPFTAADKEQAIGRVFRVGQREQVKLTTVMAHNSYDEAMNSMISSKNAIAQALLARDPNKVNDLLNNSAKLLGVETPKPPDPKLLAKFDEMANLVQVRKGSVDEMWDAVQDDEGGSLQDNEVVVNPKAAASLPPHLRTTHDMKTYVRERRAKMESDGAEMYAKMDRLVAAHFVKQGDKKRAAYYSDRAERLDGLLNKVKETKKDAPKSAPKKAAEVVKEVSAALPTKVKESTAIELTGKKNTYDASSSRKVNPKRDAAMGATSKDDHLTHQELAHCFAQIKKQKIGSVKEFVDKVLKPAYPPKTDRKVMVDYAQRVFHHLKEDGLVVHS